MGYGKQKPETERCSYCGKLKATVKRGTPARPYFMHEKCFKETEKSRISGSYGKTEQKEREPENKS